MVYSDNYNMVCIRISYQYMVCMHPYNIIMHASYYGAYIDDYAIFKTSVVYLKNLKVTALLENGMYYIPICGMYASYIIILICLLGVFMYTSLFLV